MFDPQKILVLAPHTDDGELGCGGSIAKYCNEGKQVFYAAFSHCAASLPAGAAPDTLVQECKKATASLGIPSQNLFFFDHEVRNFDTARQSILDEMLVLNKTINPDLVLMPCGNDRHQDHQVVFAEAGRAFKNASLLGYELPWNQSQFMISFFINLSADHIVAKINALKLYASQERRNYMQEDFIASLAKVRGVQAHTAFAEAFETYRIIA